MAYHQIIESTRRAIQENHPALRLHHFAAHSSLCVAQDVRGRALEQLGHLIQLAIRIIEYIFVFKH